MESKIESSYSLNKKEKKKSIILYKIKKNPMTILGISIIGIIILLAILAPYITSYDPTKISILERFKAPSSKHWFGT
ncbi:D,D-dipeptide ABC transporter permease, partial [Clostridiaceae bacterium UIB06]|nr:D,D-dipeptide ABC transporter permease [Clostridiaceae bacterium UIB06]